MNHVKELIYQILKKNYPNINDDFYYPILYKLNEVFIYYYTGDNVYKMPVFGLDIYLDVIEKHDDYISIIFVNTDIPIRFKVLSLQNDCLFKVSLVDGFE